jgi:hypothetical protein
MCVWAGSMGFASHHMKDSFRHHHIQTNSGNHPSYSSEYFQRTPSDWSVKLTTQLSVEVKNV